MEKHFNAREKEIRAARELISDERLAKFFRVIRGVEYDGFAVEMMNRCLDDGERLDEIFYTGDEKGYHLSVEQKGESSFHISFGYQAAGFILMGDGGDWEVSFGGTEVLSVGGGQSWIC